MRPLLIATVSTGLLAACSTAGISDPSLPPIQANPTTVTEALGVAPENMIETTQNWSDATRTKFWHIDQGSLTAPYDIALAIETEDGERFFSARNIARYRYVPQRALEHNPDGLPLGFTKSKVQPDGETYIGMTCAACHSTVVTYEGTGLLVDGAPSQGDFQGFYADLAAAFRATLESEARLERLAQTLGVSDFAALEARVRSASDAMQARLALNATESRYGYGRVDAIGQIFNAVASANLGIPENRGDPNAPVNYPFLWGTHQSNVVQWNGFAPNVTKFNDIRIVGPLIRNAGEVLGVFGHIDIPRETGGDPGVRYRNSTRLRNLIAIEEWLERLAPPPWPEQMFGPLDQAKVAKGAEIYRDPRKGGCASCHSLPETPFTCYNAIMVGLDKIGTDPGQALNSLRTARTGPLEGRWARLASSPDGKLGPEEPILKMLVHQVVWGGVRDITDRPVTGTVSLLKALGVEKREDKCDTPFRANDNLKAYKARPLNGIWATAPYLHNGSVPTLKALLEPEARRPEKFSLGGWEFDPVNVGYAPYEGDRAFVFDTSRRGNSNKGHLWGTDLEDEEKAALLEYLKSL